jgi:[ribosomal protein S5]-alanine N-acetyltransferase
MFWTLWRTPNYEEVVLRGSQVHLRPFQIRDAEDWYEVVRDPAVTTYLPWEPAVSVDAVRNYLMEQLGRRKRGDSLAFAILENETGKVIGSTDLMDLRIKKGHTEIGYLLGQPYWGRGIMTEAATLSVEFAFDCLKVNRLTAWADEENVGSRRVMEKIGLRPFLTETRTVKGQTRPYVGYEITRKQWEGTG